jgi:type I restriction enzyme S subunit
MSPRNTKQSEPLVESIANGDDNGDLPQGWGRTNLKDIVEVLDSQRIPVNSEERSKRSGVVPYFGATGQVGWIDDYLFDEEILLIGEDGAPFFDKSKPIAYIVRGKSWVNNHAHVLRALSKATSNLYLKYYLDWFDFTGFVNGTTRLKLTQGAMNSIPVYLPPFAEQRRIVAKLEELLGKVSSSQQHLSRVPGLLKRFRQSVLAAACSGRLTADWREENCETRSTLPIHDATDDYVPEGWRTTTVGDVIVGLKYGTSKKCDYSKDGVPVLRIPNIATGGIDHSDIKYANLESAEFQQLRLLPGDILLIRSNGSVSLVGKSSIVRSTEQDFAYAGYLIRLRPDKSKVIPDYLNTVLGTYDVRLQVELTARSTSGVNNINSEEVRALRIHLPPLLEQQEIVRRVEKLFAFADQIEARLKLAQEHVDRLTQSILAKAFRGELVPTEAELARREGRDYETASQLLARIQATQTTASPTKPKRKKSSQT